jgi:hypothetical protein
MSTEQIMSQAQVFASAWALVGGRFDNGDMLETANEEKAELQAAIEALVQERDALDTNLKSWLRQNAPGGWIDDLRIEADKLAAENKVLWDDLVFVERWVNHHGTKSCHSAESILGVIQHYPTIRAITKSYKDGVVPSTPDPYAERDAAQADALEQARLNGMGGEREAGLLGKVARLERECDALKLIKDEAWEAARGVRQRLEDERDALKANLHQVSLSHTHLHAENKVLRAAGEFELAGYALPDSAFDGMVIRKQKLSSDSIALYTRKQS